MPASRMAAKSLSIYSFIGYSLIPCSDRCQNASLAFAPDGTLYMASANVVSFMLVDVQLHTVRHAAQMASRFHHAAKILLTASPVGTLMSTAVDRAAVNSLGNIRSASWTHRLD